MGLLNGNRRGFLVSFILLLGIVLPYQAYAKQLTVGGNMGWTNFDTTNSGTPDYTTWSNGQNVEVGDILVFQYQTSFHDVYLFATKPDYDACNFALATPLAPASAGTYSWTASAAGVYYFGCSFGAGARSHCSVGQKLAVTVVTPAAAPVVAPVAGPAAAPEVDIPVPAPIVATAPVPVSSAPEAVPSVAPVPVLPTPTPAPITPLETPVPAPTVVLPVPVPAPAKVAPAPAPVAHNSTVPTPAPVIPTVPTPAPGVIAPVPALVPVIAPAPAHKAPAPSPHKAAPHPAPKHSPKHSPAPAPAPFLGPPAPPSPPAGGGYLPPMTPPTAAPSAGTSISPLGLRCLVILGASLVAALSML